MKITDEVPKIWSRFLGNIAVVTATFGVISPFFSGEQNRWLYLQGAIGTMIAGTMIAMSLSTLFGSFLNSKEDE